VQVKRNFEGQSNDRLAAILWAANGLSMTDLGAKTAIPESTLRRLVARLEMAGYVERRSVVRRVLVFRTAKADELLAGGVRAIRRLVTFADVPSTNSYRETPK
jgi:DNA-binding MarR family transcriptional regulator